MRRLHFSLLQANVRRIVRRLQPEGRRTVARRTTNEYENSGPYPGKVDLMKFLVRFLSEPVSVRPKHGPVVQKAISLIWSLPDRRILDAIHRGSIRVTIRVSVPRWIASSAHPLDSRFVHKSSEANFEGTYQSCPLYCKVESAHLYISRS